MSEGIDYVLDQPCCEGLQRPNLRPGDRATVKVNLHLRRLPAKRAGSIRLMRAGEKVFVMCGPFCDDEDGIIWWRVAQQPDMVGWCAENKQGEGYFLEKVGS